MTNDSSADVAALREIHKVFDRIFEMGPLAMAMVGADFRFQRVNKRFCDLLGYSEDELKSLTFPQITHPDDIGLNVELAEKAFNNEIPYFTLEKRYVTKAGDPVWVNLTASYIRNDLGETIVGLAMIEDISERRAAEERISGLNQELETRVSELEVGLGSRPRHVSPAVTGDRCGRKAAPVRAPLSRSHCRGARSPLFRSPFPTAAA